MRAASLAARLAVTDTFEHSASEVADETAEASARPAKGLSILVAEDNEINALLARALLTRLGHRPTIAVNGEAAVEFWLAARASGCPYDLVLMDLQMPGMDGLEAARRIRAAEAQASDYPTRIIALTANVQTEDRQSILNAGLDGLLLKPLDRERLREVLETACGPGSQPACGVTPASPHCHNSVSGPWCRGITRYEYDSGVRISQSIVPSIL